MDTIHLPTHDLIPIPTRPDLPGPPLGRAYVNHDPRNRNFLALELTTLRATHKPGQVWYRRGFFDQLGNNCTTEAFFGLMRTNPYRPTFDRLKVWGEYSTEQQRLDYYRRSLDYDDIPGNADEGTSSDAPYRLGRALGINTGWLWMMGEPQLWEYVSTLGAASVGTEWTTEMDNPDAKGFVTTGGVVRGGHEWEVIQSHQEGQYYTGLTSWGRWGTFRNSRFRITRARMADLLARQGDAIAPQFANV
jgi:hypothetical protein